jgi:hypothetical protein
MYRACNCFREVKPTVFDPCLLTEACGSNPAALAAAAAFLAQQEMIAASWHTVTAVVTTNRWLTYQVVNRFHQQ